MQNSVVPTQILAKIYRLLLKDCDLRLIKPNLIIEKYAYTIKRLLNKYRGIFGSLVVVASSGRVRRTTANENISQ